MWSERLCVSRFDVRVYFALTVASPTTNRSLIIRTARRTTIREREKIEFILVLRFRQIIGRTGDPSRGNI
jgi:hypothetical protein